MYAPAELQMTHTVVITGSVDSMSENYDMSNIDDEWVEFVTQVDKIVEPVFQGNGGRNFIFEDENKTYPYSVVTILDADNENLRKWFKDKWVNIGKKDKSGNHPPCGTSGKRRGYAKCVPKSKAAGMSKKDKESATRRKRAAQNKAGRGGTSSTKGGGKKPIRVNTKPKK
jgi:hypothetical protein